jgi:outer membrane protein OmpA-like peptidoglycan-associated protein/tetratricopeptide (TPR) repeat protein
MKKFTCIILFIGVLFSSFSMKAQVADRANKHFESFAYQEAIELYEILWQKDSLNESVAKQLATSYRLINNTEKSEQWYARVVRMTAAESVDLLYYARALQSNKKYDESKIWMDKYLENESLDKGNKIDLDYISALMKDSLRYRIKPIEVNSEASDFGVSFYKDQLIFSSAREKTTLIKRNYKWNNQNYLRMYQAAIEEDGDVKNASLFSKKLGTNYHDGPVCFNAVGNEMFLTRNNLSKSKRTKRNQEGVVSLKLYHCKKKGNDWSNPELLHFNMEGYSTGHPTLSKDEKHLYFISDRPGGFGGTDVYVSHKRGSDWSLPVNLGDKINTSENEMFPFVSADNKLFFASKGHAGLGGLDLFSVDLNDMKSEPINLGYPLNTSKDDFGLILKNDKGYFASNRLKGESFDDIYQFSIISRLLKGQVFNSETKEILGYTQVSLLRENGDLVDEFSTGADGKFQFLIPEVINYQVKSVKERFTNGEVSIPISEFQGKTESSILVYQSPDNRLFLEGLVIFRADQSPIEGMTIAVQDQQTKENLNLLSDTLGKFSCQLKRETEYNLEYRKEGLMSKYDQISTLKLPVNKIYVCEKFDSLQVGKTFVLENILYDLDKSNIREDAAIELDKLVLVMESNPGLKIELSSHTDSRGSDAYNLALSERRAKSAVAFIISRGISSDRVVAKGYGETSLINKCSNGVKCNKAEHQANRRTEVKVLEL